MEVRALYYEGDTTPSFFRCGVCETIYQTKQLSLEKTKELADKCCLPEPPKSCNGCGADIPQNSAFINCTDCRLIQGLERAERVHWADTDHCYSDDIMGYHDGYFSSVDDMRQYTIDTSEFSSAVVGAKDLSTGEIITEEDFVSPFSPCYVYLCRLEPITIDLESIIGSLCEDDGIQVFGYFELEAAIASFNSKNSEVGYYVVDRSRICVIDPVRFEHLLATGEHLNIKPWWEVFKEDEHYIPPYVEQYVEIWDSYYRGKISYNDLESMTNRTITCNMANRRVKITSVSDMGDVGVTYTNPDGREEHYFTSLANLKDFIAS